MLNKKIAAPVLAGTVLLAMLFIGCAWQKSAQPTVAGSPSRLASTLRDIGNAPAALAVSEPMRPFFAAGLGFIVLGGLTLCFGGKSAGLILIGMGAAITATGVLFVQYPWAVLILAAVAGFIAVLAVWDRWRARKQLAVAAEELNRNREALEATAEVIQKAPEGAAIKAGLSAMGEEVEGKVRAVITPIKNKLRREGKIA